MSGYLIFEAFENGISIHEDNLPKMVNYICGKLNGSSYNPNYKYFYNQYSYSNKAVIVCRWKKARAMVLELKMGEGICNNELVNFFTDENRKNCSCGSVYYK